MRPVRLLAVLTVLLGLAVVSDHPGPRPGPGRECRTGEAGGPERPSDWWENQRAFPGTSVDQAAFVAAREQAVFDRARSRAHDQRGRTHLDPAGALQHRRPRDRAGRGSGRDHDLPGCRQRRRLQVHELGRELDAGDGRLGLGDVLHRRARASTPATRTWSTPARARPTTRWTPTTATACCAARTAGRPGSRSGSRRPRASPASRWTRRTRAASSWPRWAASSRPAPTAASTAARTAGRAGARCCS